MGGNCLEISKTSPSKSPLSPENGETDAPVPSRTASGRAEIGEWLSEQIQKSERGFQRGLFTEEELRARKQDAFLKAVDRLNKQEISDEERRTSRDALQKIYWLPSTGAIPAGVDVPHRHGLFYVHGSLWPEFPPEEERLNRDFALPVRDGQRKETLFFRLDDRIDSQAANGVPCTEYRGSGRLRGYKTAELSLLVSKANPTSAAVILKLYPDLESPRWEAYFKWSSAGRE
jgi:hypothetical protein